MACDDEFGRGSWRDGDACDGTGVKGQISHDRHDSRGVSWGDGSVDVGIAADGADAGERSAGKDCNASGYGCIEREGSG